MFHQNQSQSLGNETNGFRLGGTDTQHVIKVYDRDNKQIQSEVIYQQNSGNDDEDEKGLLQGEVLNGGQRLR